MAGLGSVVVQFIGKDRLSGVATSVGKAIGGVNDESGRTKSVFGKMNAAWAASIPIAGAVVAGAVAIGNGLIEAGKAALEDKQSADKLAHTLSNIKGVTQDAITANEDWISSMQLATLVSDTDLREAVGKLALATGDLGEAQRLTTIAVDAAAGSGKNLSGVTDALAKAANGSTGALQRQFPWLDKNKDGTLTLKEATDGLTGAYKGAAKEAQKTKPWEMLQTIFGELKEAVGQALLPVLEALGKWFSNPKNQKKVQDFIDKMSELAETVGKWLVKQLEKLVEWLEKPENQQKLKQWAELARNAAREFTIFIGVIQDVIGWLAKIKIPKLRLTGGGAPSGAASSAGSWSTARTARTTPSAAQPQPQAVLVTEEQIARAVQRVLARSDARNGRLVRVG